MKPLQLILYDLHVRFDHRPADEFSAETRVHVERWKALVFFGAYNQVFDALRFVMRYRSCPDYYPIAIGDILRDCQAAYTVVPYGLTIMPQASPEEGAAITEAISLAGETGLDGARTHLRGAGGAINRGDYAGSVRESIHAVESVARKLNADASESLGPALRALEERIKLHPALKEGFSNIYGYTSDEDGIRHALNEADADVDIVDAN